MTFYELIIGALAVWRVTHLFVAEDGPYGLLARLRAGGEGGRLSGLLNCFYCLSLLVSIPFALLIGATWRDFALLWPALSALAIFAERAVNLTDPRVAVWEELPDKETSDELLRQDDSAGFAGVGEDYQSHSLPIPSSR